MIFDAPVYFWSVSDQAKTLIDRYLLFPPERRLRNKAAGAVVVKGRSRSTSTLVVFDGFFTLQKMTMAGRAIGFGHLEKGEVKKDERGMADAETLRKNIVKYIQTDKFIAR
jgi:multimeric flavodoxin WrbA